MKVQHIPCGSPANESERKAILFLMNKLQAEPGDGEWILFTNWLFSVTNRVQSDEIDILLIGPPGVRVIEVKHWDDKWARDHQEQVTHEVEKLTNKVKKIATTVRNHEPAVGFVEGCILLTRETSALKNLRSQPIRGIPFLGLTDWKTLLEVKNQHWTAVQVKNLCRMLEPRSAVALEGDLRRFGGLVNLELITPPDERFHRIYKGRHSVRQDKVILHLYDLSAHPDKNAEQLARREFEALQRAQRFRWAPRILDSFHDAPGYPGEMYYFSLVDPSAPALHERLIDTGWKTRDRLAFALESLRALKEMHHPGEESTPIIHRNLTPATIRIRHDGIPIFTGFHWARIPTETSIAPAQMIPNEWEQAAAPEIRQAGLAAASERSDLYSLCFSLRLLFENQTDDDLARQAGQLLEGGLQERPEERETPDQIMEGIGVLLGQSLHKPTLPPARFWTEDQTVHFHGREYRIVSYLGGGGIGTTFKVIEFDRTTQEDLGTYVGKVVHSRDHGGRVLNAYNRARHCLGRSPGLSAIYEVATEWKDNDFVALMTWIEGAPLSDFIGVFPLLAEELGEKSPEVLAVRWIRNLCAALHDLHKHGLIHGDVSPRNIIVSGQDVVLTDYDFVTKIGEPRWGSGTELYCAPLLAGDTPAQAADDLYALAASFFHVLTEKEPFLWEGRRDKARGLHWDEHDLENYPKLSTFLHRAADPDPSRRFASVEEALTFLKDYTQEELPVEICVPEVIAPREVQEGRVEWLYSLLQSYPGSQWGNQETRGLDTPFAAQTYVETRLEETLLREIRTRQIRLVILCGNAGDGKTALLQHLAQQLGFGSHQSAERIIELRLEDGPLVRINLDGSAAWQGRSSDELLNEFLGPFQSGDPAEDIVHLLAINDGRLLEWIDSVGPTALTNKLTSFLLDDPDPDPSRAFHVRFINLNDRSLVGGLNPGRTKIETTFLDRLVDRLYGGEQAEAIWKPCLNCAARDRCRVFQAQTVFGPDSLPMKESEATRRRARERLFEALQAVHLRGEVHITTRELRAALVYILFGIHACEEYHNESASQVLPYPYWDQVFAAEAAARQGEVLRELIRFDPAFEAHPQIDRYLISQPSPDDRRTAPRYPHLSLASARRRAYFEWTEAHLEEIAWDQAALGLARGRHLDAFRRIPLEQAGMGHEGRKRLCEKLCAGISRLENLPPQAYKREGKVPLRITPRTPTETAFWVEKPLERFRLEADLPVNAEGFDILHRQAYLIYEYQDGQRERLRLGAELFYLLMEIAEGYQLVDVSTDDTFAHLSIFVQRLAREDERSLMAYNPMNEETIYNLAARIEQGPNDPVQNLVLIPVE